ncbi:hypothetical protein CsSME_00000538 [Camellia sinensis var. sinensis]
MMEDECASNTVPVPNVDANILAMAIEFCQEALYDLTTAANFLDVKELLDALCQNAAEMIKGKSRGLK